MTFATFRKREQKVLKSVLIICISNFLTGIFASVVVFGYLGYFAHQSNVEIRDLPIQGMDLTFVTYPAALGCLPYPRVWMVIFFLTLLMIGIDS